MLHLLLFIFFPPLESEAYISIVGILSVLFFAETQHLEECLAHSRHSENIYLLS